MTMTSKDYKEQAKRAVERCTKRYGRAAWQAFGEDIRDAMVCREIVSCVMAAHSMGGGTVTDIANIAMIARDAAREA